MQIAPRPTHKGSFTDRLYMHILTNGPQTFAQLHAVFPIESRLLQKVVGNSARRGYLHYANATGQYSIEDYPAYILKRQRLNMLVRQPDTASPTIYTVPKISPAPVVSAPVEIAPRPKRGRSYYAAVYDTLLALGKPASLSEIRKLLPAALMGNKPMPTIKQLGNIIYQASRDGYIFTQMRGSQAIYSVADRAYYEAKQVEYAARKGRLTPKPSRRVSDAPVHNQAVVTETVAEQMPAWKAAAIGAVAAAAVALSLSLWLLH